VDCSIVALLSKYLLKVTSEKIDWILSKIIANIPLKQIPTCLDEVSDGKGYRENT
jgi:hypothetical protein